MPPTPRHGATQAQSAPGTPNTPAAPPPGLPNARVFRKLNTGGVPASGGSAVTLPENTVQYNAISEQAATQSQGLVHAEQPAFGDQPYSENFQ